MTSAINEVSAEQMTEKVLRTAAAAGVKRYRMGYYKYDLGKPIRPQLDEFRPRLKDLVALSRELGIKPIYQNHSGKDYFGGPVWDLCEVLAEFDPAHVGIASTSVTPPSREARPGRCTSPRHVPTSTPSTSRSLPGRTTPSAGAPRRGRGRQGFLQTAQGRRFQGSREPPCGIPRPRRPAMVPTVLKAIGKDFATLKTLLS